MPHLVIERERGVPAWVADMSPYAWVGKGFSKKRCAYIIDIVDMFGGILFVWGSVDFLPQFSLNPHTFVHGCELFTLGGLVYFFVSVYCLSESIEKKGVWSLESCENILYVAGCWVFLVGTILYWPFDLDHPLRSLRGQGFNPRDQYSLYANRAGRMGVGLPVYVNSMSTAFKGTMLFIVGSMMFTFAAFANALNQRHFHDNRSQLLTIVTTVYMLGSLLFCMGSVAFLPDFGCNEKMQEFGAWCFVIGSMQFVIGSAISLRRAMLQSEKFDDDCEEENMIPLLAKVMDP